MFPFLDIADRPISTTKIVWRDGVREPLLLYNTFKIYNFESRQLSGSIEITNDGDMDIFTQDDIRLRPNDDVHIFYGTETSAWATFNGGEKALVLHNQSKISFDGDSTNTYIAASTEIPEDLEIHADYNLDLLPDNNVNIYVGSTNYATFDGGLQALHMKGQSKIIFDSTDSYIAANTDNPEDLEIHADQDILLMPDQYVGIGTTTPRHKLDVPDVGGLIISYVALENASNQTFALTTTMTNVASTAQDAKITFIAPSSGKVELQISAYLADTVGDAQILSMSIGTDSTYNSGNSSANEKTVHQTDESDDVIINTSWVLTGLTAGTSYTYYIAAKSSANSNHTFYWGNTRQPFIIRAVTLPSTIVTDN